MRSVEYFKAELPPCDKKEVLRYAGCKGTSVPQEILSMADECIAKAEEAVSCGLCYCELPLNVADDLCDMGDISVRSADLARNLRGCETVVVFAATVGVEIDRLIAKYGRISPTKALIFQAVGTERVEALCDVFCQSLIKNGKALRPRFSAGYGDLPLNVQKDIFNLLRCQKIGITLNDSLLISPSKSVTAFVGISSSCGADGISDKCKNCNNINCDFRGLL